MATGDGFFVAFESPDDALACAVGIQRALAEHRSTAGFAPAVRIGLHASDATMVGRNFTGKGVHEASRIGGLADGGQIVASAETAAGGAFPTLDPRTVTVKGISDPIEVVTVDWHEAGVGAAPILSGWPATPPRPLRDRIGILKPLAVRDFAFLWTGMTVSMIGDGIYLVAIAWQVLQIENRPGALALVGIAWSLPQVVLVLASGALADRLDRRLLMIAGDVIRFFAIGTLGVLSLDGQLTIPIVLVLVLVYGAGQAVFQPSFQSITPTIVPSDLLVQANSLAQLVRPFAMTLVGPLVGGLLVAWFSAGVGVPGRRRHVRVLRRDDPVDADPAPGEPAGGASTDRSWPTCSRGSATSGGSGGS